MPDSPFIARPSSCRCRRRRRSGQSVLAPQRGRLAAKLPRQLLRSWYIVYFQLPWLPERSARWMLPLLWRRWSPGYPAARTSAMWMPRSAHPSGGGPRWAPTVRSFAAARCLPGTQDLQRFWTTAAAPVGTGAVPARRRRWLYDSGFHALGGKGAAGRKRHRSHRARRALPGTGATAAGRRTDSRFRRSGKLIRAQSWVWARVSMRSNSGRGARWFNAAAIRLPAPGRMTARCAASPSTAASATSSADFHKNFGNIVSASASENPAAATNSVFTGPGHNVGRGMGSIRPTLRKPLIAGTGR